VKSLPFFSLALFVTALLFTLPSQTGAGSPGQQDRFEQMDSYFKTRLEAAPVPGGGYAIVEDGQILHLAAFGVSNLKEGRRLTVNTPMMIGSVGKTITALAIRQLANAGKIDLSAPVTRYLPWFRLATPGAAGQITLQNLLEHQSGLSKNDGQDLPRVYRPGLTPEAVARSLEEIHLVHQPGTVYEYSNLNYVLLGVVVEAASGQSYGDYLQEHIFQPLRMDHSTVEFETAKAAGLTDGHHYLFGFPVAYQEPFPSGVVPAGYQITCLEDMAHYAAAFTSGGEYGGVSILRLGGKPASRKPILDIHWGAGQSFNPGDSFAQSGATLNANAALEIMPLKRLGVVVMFNSNPEQFLGIPEGASDVSNELLRMYLGIDQFRPRSPSTRTVYLFIDVLLLALAAGTGWHLLTLRTWRARLEKTPSRRWFLARSLLSDAFLPLAILLGLPLLLQSTGGAPLLASWPVFSRQLPDISYTLLAAAFAWIVTGLVKAFWISRPSPPVKSSSQKLGELR
jgi:CubicO group peptidase (beta-lactamase class C family)